ncbi:MAG: 50S ribosomal protein L29 [bacterium]
MKATAFREMTLPELELKIEELRKSLFNLRVRATTKELNNVAQLRLEKRNLARALTVLHQKQASQAK